MTEPNLERDYARAVEGLRGNLTAIGILGDVTLTVARDEYTTRHAMSTFLRGIPQLRRIVNTPNAPQLRQDRLREIDRELEQRSPATRRPFVEAVHRLAGNPIAQALFVFAMWSASMDDSTDPAELQHIAMSGVMNAQRAPTRAQLDAARPLIVRELRAFVERDRQYERDLEAEERELEAEGEGN